MMNKKKVLITLLSILVIAVIVILVVIKNNFSISDTTFYLLGKENVVINVGDKYFERGFLAQSKEGKDLSNKVIIEGEVDVNTPGEYTITYTLKDNKGFVQSIKRKIVVAYSNKFILNGEANVYLLLNGKYDDEGVKAYYNEKDYSNTIKPSGKIDSSIKGTYNIKYTFLEMNSATIERKIYVSDFSEFFKVEYQNGSTNKNIDVKITIDIKKISKYVLPNGEEVKEATKNYTINKNGDYSFTIYDNYENSLIKTINIDNINKNTPTGTCNITYTGNTTNVTVKNTGTLKIAKYSYNGIVTTNDTYTVNQKLSDVNVIIYDEAGNYSALNCSKNNYSKELEIHFIATGYYDDAILIRTDDKVILIDSGRYGCRKKVTPYLKDLGVTKIDAMIGSHMHNDHIAAQADILDNFPVSTIYYNDDIFNCYKNGSCDKNDQEYIVDALKKYNKTPIIQKAGTKLTIGEMTLYFLGPEKIGSSQNGNSFIFILKYYNNTFMFTGDVDLNTSRTNAAKSFAGKLGISMSVDVLKYPHHGNSTISDEFFKASTPKYVIVPNYNASKYPSSSNKNKVSNYGAKMYRQSDYKNILLKSDGTSIKVITDVTANDYKR